MSLKELTTETTDFEVVAPIGGVISTNLAAGVVCSQSLAFEAAGLPLKLCSKSAGRGELTLRSS